MTSRLIKVMEHYDYSPSIFADEVGVIRSSISHVLNGRNKPGLDLIQKVLTRFPDVSAEWLLLGQGSMLKANTNVNSPQALQHEAKPERTVEKLPLELFIEAGQRQAEEAGENPMPAHNDAHVSEVRENKIPERPEISRKEKTVRVKRITLYYADGSYEDFTSGQPDS